MLPDFSNVVNIIVVIPAASCSADRRSFSALRRMKTYHRNNIWGNSVSVTSALIYIKRNTANSKLNNDMDRIIDIFGPRNGRDGNVLTWSI